MTDPKLLADRVIKMLAELQRMHVAVTAGSGYDPKNYSSTYSEAADLIRDLTRHGEALERVQEGWRLVPVEPTPEMKHAASQANQERLRKHFKRILEPECAGWAAEQVYRAMIQASPEYVSHRHEDQFSTGDPHPLDVARFDCHYDGDWKACDKEMCKREQLCRRRDISLERSK